MLPKKYIYILLYVFFLFFRELLLGGQEVAGLLILSLINQYLTDNASVDSISRELREVCPNLYRNEDAACSKVFMYYIFYLLIALLPGFA